MSDRHAFPDKRPIVEIFDPVVFTQTIFEDMHLVVHRWAWVKIGYVAVEFHRVDFHFGTRSLCFAIGGRRGFRVWPSAPAVICGGWKYPLWQQILFGLLRLVGGCSPGKCRCRATSTLPIERRREVLA